MARCNYCDRAIVWAVHRKTGCKAPFDVSGEKVWTIEDGYAKRVSVWVPHQVTCGKPQGEDVDCSPPPPSLSKAPFDDDAPVAEPPVFPDVSPPPAWVRPGAVVDFHSIIGGPVTRSSLKVVIGPQLMGRTWVVWLDGYRGCVCVEALSRPETLFGPDAESVSDR